eukprot:TRINITY_DN25_c0_g1_i4.p1 TRINITY_DN25_c0_g1~~TRINITY_DN25_c0_g1_i4.p1  ORF type:complete len:616 (+),score=223.51 TRINITY_DN25_c0_g1_i4:65-1912(+)
MASSGAVEDPCPICHQSLAADPTKILACGHTYHTECWEQYIVTTGTPEEMLRCAVCRESSMSISSAASQLMAQQRGPQLADRLMATDTVVDVDDDAAPEAAAPSTAAPAAAALPPTAALAVAAPPSRATPEPAAPLAAVVEVPATEAAPLPQPLRPRSKAKGKAKGKAAPKPKAKAVPKPKAKAASKKAAAKSKAKAKAKAAPAPAEPSVGESAVAAADQDGQAADAEMHPHPDDLAMERIDEGGAQPQEPASSSSAGAYLQRPGFLKGEVICSWCGQAVQMEKVRCMSKASPVYKCDRCNVRLCQLHRAFGSWPSCEFRGLPAEVKTQFYKDLSAACPKQDQVSGIVKKFMSAYEDHKEVYACLGEYLPLDAWKVKGFDVQRIEQFSKPDNIKYDEVLGKVYRVAIMSGGTQGERGNRREDSEEAVQKATKKMRVQIKELQEQLAAQQSAPPPAVPSSDSEATTSSSSSSSSSSKMKKKSKKSKKSKTSKKKKSARQQKEKEQEKLRKSREEAKASAAVQKVVAALFATIGPAHARMEALTSQPAFAEMPRAVKDGINSHRKMLSEMNEDVLKGNVVEVRHAPTAAAGRKVISSAKKAMDVAQSMLGMQARLLQ